MPKYSKKTIESLVRIIDSASVGRTFTLRSNTDAVNMRQRLYNYRNMLKRNGDNPEMLERINNIQVSINGKMLQVTEKLPDYMDDIEEQLDGEEKDKD